MDHFSAVVESETEAKQLARGRVLASRTDGTVLVVFDQDDISEIRCDVLHTSEAVPLQLASGDRVLVWLPTAADERGVIVGRIGPSRVPAPAPPPVPEVLVLEASQYLTLKCGEGEITLRADGKVLIKGKDLVSHAERVNRIKGGSVAIN